MAGALLQIGLQPDPQLGPHGVALQPGQLDGGEGDADGQGQAGHPRPRQGGEVQGGGRGRQPQAEGGHGEPGAEAERGGGQHQTSHLSQVPGRNKTNEANNVLKDANGMVRKILGRTEKNG